MFPEGVTLAEKLEGGCTLFLCFSWFCCFRCMRPWAPGFLAVSLLGHASQHLTCDIMNKFYQHVSSIHAHTWIKPIPHAFVALFVWTLKQIHGGEGDCIMNLTPKINTEPQLFDIRMANWLLQTIITKMWGNEGPIKVKKVGKWKSESRALELFQRKIPSLLAWAINETDWTDRRSLESQWHRDATTFESLLSDFLWVFKAVPSPF